MSGDALPKDDPSALLGLLARTPRLAKGCRLGEGLTLLLPEGLLRLSATARLILERCDGSRRLGEIIAGLQESQPSELHARIELETASFIQALFERRALDLS